MREALTVRLNILGQAVVGHPCGLSIQSPEQIRARFDRALDVLLFSPGRIGLDPLVGQGTDLERDRLGVTHVGEVQAVLSLDALDWPLEVLLQAPFVNIFSPKDMDAGEAVLRGPAPVEPIDMDRKREVDGHLDPTLL